MALITSAERDRLFDSFERDAFHLELRDDYGSPVEDTPYARWQRGEPDDFQARQRLILRRPRLPCGDA